MFPRISQRTSSGQYTAVDIHIGHYDIKVEASGFKTEERKGMLLQVGDRARADFQLQVGGSSGNGDRRSQHHRSAVG